MGVVRDSESQNMSANSNNITEDEAALYDRQIRLWGLECQKRIREANILVIGLNGLGAEIVKNLTLSGVKSITIMDEKPVSETDMSSQFFAVGAEKGLGRATASQAGIQALNPNVSVKIDSDPVSSKTSNFFADFTLVFACDSPLSQLLSINKACREHEVLFVCGDVYGMYGVGFVDLLKHTFTKTVHGKDSKSEGKEVLETLNFCPLGQALEGKVGAGLNKKINPVFILNHILNNFRETHNRFPSPSSRSEDLELLKNSRSVTVQNLGLESCKVTDKMLEMVFGELSPVCAVIGGIMANEIIKGISRKGEPLYNFLLFDGNTCSGVVETVIVKD